VPPTFRTRIILPASALALLLSACTRDGKVDQSLGSGMAQGIASTAPSHHRLHNLPGYFSATVVAPREGDHWDAHGRRYVPELVLGCTGRESVVTLRFSAGPAPSTPLSTRAPLRIALALDGGAPRSIVLTPNPGSYRIEGGLPLVHELLVAQRARLEALTADNKPLVANFDLRGLKSKLARYDFYCAQQWLADAAPQPTRLPGPGMALPAQVHVSNSQRSRLEELRTELSRIEGVVSTLWMPDTTLMIAMSRPSPAESQRAVQSACELLRNYPEAKPQVQVQDLSSSTAEVTRMACPR